MRNLLFITITLLLFSCTVKKRDQTIAYTDVQEDTPVTKKFVYVDTPVQDEPTVVYDTATQIVEAPVEEKFTPPSVTGDTVEVDTTVYRWQLAISEDSVAEWRKMKQFAYVKNLDSLLKAEKEKKKEVKQPVDRISWLDRFLSSNGLQFFLWVLAGAFVLFVIYKLFVTGGPLKRRSTTIARGPTAAEEEITHESDFDRLIREAEQQRNYRLAVRYRYLQTLHTLAQKNYVQMAADKTNYSYVHEIKDYNKQTEFAGLTLNYEYVWYGGFDIDELIYTKIKTAFNAFNTKI